MTQERHIHPFLSRAWEYPTSIDQPELGSLLWCCWKTINLGHHIALAEISQVKAKGLLSIVGVSTKNGDVWVCFQKYLSIHLMSTAEWKTYGLSFPCLKEDNNATDTSPLL